MSLERGRRNIQPFGSLVDGQAAEKSADQFSQAFGPMRIELVLPHLDLVSTTFKLHVIHELADQVDAPSVVRM